MSRKKSHPRLKTRSWKTGTSITQTQHHGGPHSLKACLLGKHPAKKRDLRCTPRCCSIAFAKQPPRVLARRMAPPRLGPWREHSETRQSRRTTCHPPSAPMTTRRALPPSPGNSEQVRSFFFRASFRAAPSMVGAGRVVPSRRTGDTIVVSMASCAPCHSVRPSATTSSLHPSNLLCCARSRSPEHQKLAALRFWIAVRYKEFLWTLQETFLKDNLLEKNKPWINNSKILASFSQKSGP